MLDGADAALERQTNNETHQVDAVSALMQFGDLGHDLVKGGIDETVELDLAHRAVPANRESDRGADYGRLGEWRVDDAVLSKVLLQSVGDAKDAAEFADVLTHQQHFLVLLHRATKSLVEGFGHRHGGRGHQCEPPPTPRSIISRRPSSTSGCGAA